MKKILIIHPEGNINNNPNLTGIVEILCENNYIVHIYSPKIERIYQDLNYNNATLFLLEGNISVTEGFLLLAIRPFASFERITTYIKNKIDNYDLVIGVDRGIIEASLIAQVKKIPYGLISYEIFFEEEAGKEFKQPEIEACRDIDFAICQDKVRVKHLSIENRIPLEKIITIPMGGRFAKKGEKNSYLYESLEIDKEKKIALFIGSITRWSMVDFIIESAQTWPDDWVLVIHPRYGMNQGVFFYYEKYKELNNIYFSLESVSDLNRMYKIIHSADIGIALYKPQKNIKKNITLDGNNIRYIGMASGKIATYFQHGLPIIINEIGEMSDYVRKYDLGVVIDDSKRIKLYFTDSDIVKWRKNCFEFFEREIDLNYTVDPLLKTIQYLLEKKSVTTIKRPPDEIRRYILISYANFYAQKGEYKKVIEKLKEASTIRKVPDGIKFQIILTLANCYSNQGKYTEAEEKFNEALLLKVPGQTKFHAILGLANCYSNQGKYTEALLLKVPGQTKFHAILGLANCYSNQGKYTEAEEKFNETLFFEEVPYSEKVFAHYNLGSMHERGKDYAKAKNEFETVLVLGKDINTPKQKKLLGNTHFHLGCIYRVLNKLKEAKSEFENCLKLNPDHKKAKEIANTLNGGERNG